MLIDRVMSFCDSEYRNAHRNTRCEDCLHTGDCSRNCKDCLEEIHYPSRHPNGKKFYDCPHLINFYVCDYAYKYATEIYYLLQKSDALAEIEHYSIFSIGCGACPDLMAFELYLQRNAPGKTLEYRGIDKNPLWESIHNQVLQYTTADITCRHRPVFVLPCISLPLDSFSFCNTNNYHTFAEIAIRTLKWFVITSA